MNFINNFFSKYPDEKLVRYFKFFAFGEGVTCFFLYIIAIPLKRYFPEELWATIFIIIVGNIHGLFFTLYLILCIPMRKIFIWDDEDSVFAFLSAFFPFATVWIERKFTKLDRE